MLGEQFMVGSEVCGAVISVRFQVHVILQAFQSNNTFNEDCLEVTAEKVSCCLPIAKQPPLHHSHVGCLVPFDLSNDFKLCHTLAKECTVLDTFGHKQTKQIINRGKTVIGHTIRDSKNNSFHKDLM